MPSGCARRPFRTATGYSRASLQNRTALSPLCRSALAPYLVAQTPPRQTTKGKSKPGKKVTKGPVSLTPTQ